MKELKIPNFIIRKTDKDDFVNRLEAQMRLTTKAYHDLLSISELDGIPTELTQVNEDDINALIDEKTTTIDALGYLTNDTKAKAKEKWEAIRTKATECARTIRDLVNAYPSAEFSMQNGEIICKNIDALIGVNCRTIVPQKVKDHINLIAEAHQAITKLQDFEHSNGYPTGTMFNLDMDIRMYQDTEQMLNNWLWQDQAREIANRTAQSQSAHYKREQQRREAQKAIEDAMRQKSHDKHPKQYEVKL